MPPRAGLAPLPIAVLYEKTLLYTCHDTPMLESAAPFEHVLPSAALLLPACASRVR